MTYTKKILLFGSGELGREGAETDIRIFGKPVTRPYRRMAVALATGADTDAARALVKRAADAVRIEYK